MHPLLLMVLSGKISSPHYFDKRFTFSSKRRAQGMNSNTQACTHTCTLSARSEISLYQWPRAVTAGRNKRSTARTALMRHEIVFSKGKKLKRTYLHSPAPKSDAGLRNKRTPRGKRETGIFIHSMSDAEWILARTSFPRISQLLSEFKRRKHPSFWEKTLPSSFF